MVVLLLLLWLPHSVEMQCGLAPRALWKDGQLASFVRVYEEAFICIRIYHTFWVSSFLIKGFVNAWIYPFNQALNLRGPIY